MSHHPLADIAWRFNALLHRQGARERCLEYCRTYLRDADAKGPALSLPDDVYATREPSRSYSLADRCAILCALHSVVCHTAEKIDPADHWPGNIPLEPKHSDGIAWTVLLSEAKNLTERDRTIVEAMLADMEADLSIAPSSGFVAKPEDEAEIAGKFSGLKALAARLLKGDQRKIVESICDRNGSIPFADLATILSWNADEAGPKFNDHKKEIDKKLKGDRWKLYRHDNRAEARQIGEK